MNKPIKWAGSALVLGALLMFTRMAPIFAVLPDDMAFPPETTSEMIRLAKIAGLNWQVSHIMGLAAVILFALAYAIHAKILIRQGWNRIGYALAVIATLAFGLFGIALTIDGFVVPAANESLERVAETHQLALRFFTPGVFLMFVAMALLSSPILHRAIHARWLGVMGQVIGILAVTAYLFGVTGPNWNNLQIGGSLMMAAFAWHLLVGSRAVISRSETAGE